MTLCAQLRLRSAWACAQSFNLKQAFIYLKDIHEARPGVLGNRGMGAYFSGEQGNKDPKMRGTGEQRQFWGTGNIENQDFVFGEQGKKAIYFRGTRELVPPTERASYM